MTLLTAINAVCDVVSLDRFDSVYGADDPNALTMLAMAKEAGEEIARRADWQALLKSVSLVGSPANLPADYERLVPGGAVRTTAGDFVRIVTNSGQWAVISAASPATPCFFVRAGRIEIAPPAVAVGAAVDYVSKNWIVTDPYAEVADWTADDDTTLFAERLLEKGILWRWRRQKGLPYEDSLAEFEADLQHAIDADRGVS
ncbi:UNVERIFIED_ORG: hypothetical protein LHK14_01615 [Roseateles sp. XES5]|nr:hypothetical protein [Roseateles sp. XES5]